MLIETLSFQFFFHVLILLSSLSNCYKQLTSEKGSPVGAIFFKTRLRHLYFGLLFFFVFLATLIMLHHYRVINYFNRQKNYSLRKQVPARRWLWLRSCSYEREESPCQLWQPRWCRVRDFHGRLICGKDGH